MYGPRRTLTPIDWTGVPLRYRFRFVKGQLVEHPGISAAVHSLEEAQDLVKFYGDPRFCPLLPVLLVFPNDIPPTVIIGNGGTADTMADAAELRDLAVYVWERTMERAARNGGKLFDSAEMRDRYGLVPEKERLNVLRQALVDRVAQHRRTQRTDPGRRVMDQFAGHVFGGAAPKEETSDD